MASSNRWSRKAHGEVRVKQQKWGKRHAGNGEQPPGRGLKGKARLRIRWRRRVMNMRPGGDSFAQVRVGK